MQSTMAEAASTYVSELVDHMKGLTEVTDEEILLGLAIEHVANGAAEKLASKQGNNNEVENIYGPVQNG